MAQTPRQRHLEILPDSQRRLWDELAEIPEHFALYGGTAISLHLGHRQSVDFDLFSFRELDIWQLRSSLALLKDAETVQLARNTLTVRVDRGGPVLLSFFGVPTLRRVQAPERAADDHLAVASLLDLAATKVEDIQARMEAKDYLDVDALLTLAGLDLPTMLAAAAAVFGPQFNAQISLKALSYFGDVGPLPTDVADRLAAAARAVNLDQLPVVLPLSNAGDLQA